MVGDRDVDGPAPNVGKDHQNEQQPTGGGGHDKEVGRHQSTRMIPEEGTPGLGGRPPPPVHVFRNGGLRDIEPSFNNSPCIRGAPHTGFVSLMVRIRCCRSCDTGGRPFRRRRFQLQYRRKAWRCHAMTVSGCANTVRQSRQSQLVPKHQCDQHVRIFSMDKVVKQNRRARH